MTFRARLLVVSLPLALVPLALFGAGARRELTRRLETQYAERVAALATVVSEELQSESKGIAERLEQLTQAMSSDTRLRVALLNPAADADTRAYLLDYAPRAMPLAALDVLRIHGADGEVLSSGHFRNEYGTVDPALSEAFAHAANGPVLAEIATPTGSMHALTRGTALGVGSRTFTVVGGIRVDEAFMRRLTGGTGLEVTLVTGTRPDGAAAAADSAELVREVAVPFVTRAGDSVARFVVRASDAPLVDLRRDLDRWFIGAAVVAALLAALLAAVAAAQLSHPLATLARRAGRIDLDRLDVSFPTERLDEVGDLSRVLNRMTARLRGSAARLRDAERRATTGDIARQVHHDVRNGLIPIRNVLSHLTQVAQESPGDLRDVFLQRQGTLESSVTYLQSLATSYARLSPSIERHPCDVNRIAAAVVADAPAADGGGRARVESDLTPGLPPVLADPVALRRVLDNLVVNAIESLGGHPEEGSGRVLVWTRVVPAPAGSPSLVQLGVTDTGRGMSVDERARMFDDFYTTKARGTGLGLSIVRRLVNDMGGRIDVESEPEQGTRFTVELPAAAGAADPGSEHSVVDEDALPMTRRTNHGFGLHPEQRR